MALIPGQTTLGQIRQTAWRRCGQENGGSLDLDEWTDYVISSLQELHGVIVQSFGDNYRVKLPSFSFTTDGTSDWYPLPADFFKLLVAEYRQIPGDSRTAIKLERINFNEKDHYSTFGYFPGVNGLSPYYCDLDDQILLVPRAQSGLTIFLWYIPRLRFPAESGTVTLSQVVAGNAFTLNGVVFTAVASGATGAQFNVGASDTLTAANLATAINGSSLSGLLTAVSSGPIVTLGLNNVLQPGTVSVTLPSATFALYPDVCWSNLVDGVNGWEEYAVVDVCIKAAIKLENDSGPYERQKAFLLHRLQQETKHRDAGSPKTMTHQRVGGPGRGRGRGR